MNSQQADKAAGADRVRVLFFAEAVTLAHVARPVVLAQGLDSEQYEVHFASDPRYNHLFSNLPEHRAIDSIASQQFLDALAKGSPVYDAPTLERYVHEDMRVIDEVRPDVVVGDFRLSLGISCAKAGVPYVNITNAYWSPYSTVRFDIPEHVLAKVLGVGVARVLFRMVRPMIFAMHTVPMNRVRRRFGLPSLGLDLRRVYTEADHILYADLPGLAPTRGAPDNHHYIGPVLWSPEVELPAWWDSLPTDKPIIYATPGSSGQTELLPMVLEALADLPVCVIGATAGRVKPERVPRNAFLADFLPGIEAAKRASLVICNGGSPTTYQALAGGTPVLGIPSNLDQYLNMYGVLKTGAGRMVRAGKLSRQVLRGVVEDLLGDEGYCEAAKRMGRCIEQYDADSPFKRALNMSLNKAHTESS